MSVPNLATFQHDDEIRLHFINVGFGDCILVQIHDEFILIDYRSDLITNGYTYLSNYFEAAGLTTEVGILKKVIITHFHADHFMGLDRILDTFDVDNNNVMISPYRNTKNIKRLWTANAFLRRKSYEKIEMPKGTRLSKIINPFLELEIFNPTVESLRYYKRHSKGNPNNSSIGFILICKNNSGAEISRILFPGDMQKVWKENVQDINGDVSCDIYKCAHHGETKGTPDFLFDRMLSTKPIIAVAMDHEKNNQRCLFEKSTILNVRKMIKEGCSQHKELGYILNLRDNTAVNGDPRGVILIRILPTVAPPGRSFNIQYIATKSNGQVRQYFPPKPIATFDPNNILMPWTVDKSNREYKENEVIDIDIGTVRDYYEDCEEEFDV